MKDKVISVCSPVITLQSKYWTMIAFLFCPPVIGVQVYRLLAQPMVCKEMMQHTDDGVGALPHVDSLIDQVVHLSREGLTTYTKDSTLSGCQEVHGAGLKRIVWVKHLLRHVETVVGRDRCGVGWSL